MSLFDRKYLREGLYVESKGWLVELISGLISWHYNEPKIVLTTIISKGLVVLYLEFLSGLEIQQRFQHEFTRNVAASCGLVLATPALANGEIVLGVVSSLIGGAICVAIFSLVDVFATRKGDAYHI